MSRLRRDRRAMRWARYAWRGEKLSGVGNTRGTSGEWAAIGWKIRRGWRIEHVLRLFYGY